ncbi:MAG TPA: TetR/AcrR family transcriptional regulator [Acidimicrobiales bacterium]|nr:TetR/AcrR family transcriptional regulator [Acidimicrobiales bacterium]
MGSTTLELVGRGRSGMPPASGLVAGASAQRLRIVDAAMRCIAAHGLSKTTLDDVARAAGCSRATVYRAFPGGKDAVIGAAVETELSRFFSDLAVAVAGASSLEDALVEGVVAATAAIAGHEALAFLLEHEPELVLPHLTFEHHDRLLARSAEFAAPFLGRWLDHDEAMRVAEFATRIVLSYLANPSQGIDLSDPQCARRVVRTYVLPGVRVLASGCDAPFLQDHVDNHRTVPYVGLTASKGEAS